MSDESSASRNLPVEVRSAIRKEAIDQAAKWVIGTLIAVTLFALAGWWLLLEPKLKSYISDAAGGVPSGAVLASTVECQDLPGKWEAFLEGQGRFLIGAGNKPQPSYMNWTPEGGVPTKLSQYNRFDFGGEERHTIKVSEVPQINAVNYGQYGGGHDTNGVHHIEIKQQNASINTLPPYVAVFFCKRQ